MKVLRPWSPDLRLRDWQERAVRRFHTLDKPNFLAVKTMGSGKTLFALRAAHDLLSDGAIERVVVVVFTEHLKMQWAAAAARTGIDLDPTWANADGVEAPDFHGVVVTYQQVSYAPDLYRANCRRPTFVILDEAHHVGESLDWGNKLQTAFEPARYRLLLSGTPFRHDGNPIPFVSYDERGVCLPDSIYSYGEGLADGVCRPVYFYTRKGRVGWVRGDGREISAEMLDRLPRQQAAERLRAALDPSGNWLRDVLREADQEITQKRGDGHATAAGLVVANDQPHARRIAALLKQITGEAPALATSDEPEASRTIQEFARPDNWARWIVAVKMISEGVDIPRLRVGVFATTTLTKLFFLQVVGRLLRVISNLGEQSAVLFIPAVAPLIEYALALKAEREQFLSCGANGRHTANRGSNAGRGAVDNAADEAMNGDGANGAASGGEYADGEQTLMPVSVEADDADRSAAGANPDGGNSGDGGGGNTRNFSIIVPLYSEALPHDTIFNGMRFSPDELERAAQVGRDLGVRLPAAQLAALLKHGFEAPGDNQSRGAANGENAFAADAAKRSADASPKSSFESEKFAARFNADNRNLTKSERKRRIREQINLLTSRLARRLKIEERDLHRAWLDEMNGSRQSEATEDELLRKLQWLANGINGSSGAGQNGDGSFRRNRHAGGEK